MLLIVDPVSYTHLNKYFVTNYHSDWAKEGQPETCQLTAGKKIVDTKLGTRAAMQLSLIHI